LYADSKRQSFENFIISKDELLIVLIMVAFPPKYWYALSPEEVPTKITVPSGDISSEAIGLSTATVTD
jgi:hypothetical protein